MNVQTMKAIVSTGYGGPEVLKLQTVQKPIPNENEVLIKIHAASITRAETMMRTGYPLIGRLFTGLIKPKNPISGTGFAGVVKAVGPGVRSFKIGDAVFGESVFKFGTYAEYICLDEKGVLEIKPDNISYEEAAVVGDGHMTSWNFLKNIANIQAGQSVLINGASGSLGTAAVQLAKHFGAEVTGVCSTKNIALVKRLGADKVIDYTMTDFTTLENQYDIIYDTVGKSSFSACKGSLTESGIYLSPVLNFQLLFQMLITSMFGQKKAKFAATGMLPVDQLKSFLKEIRKLLSTGKLKSIIDTSFHLDQIPEGHHYVDQGHKKGNVVARINLYSKL